MNANILGTLFTLGMGPGDPELLTLKAARILGQAPVVAYFAKAGQRGHARTIAEGHIGGTAEELRFDYPITVELPRQDGRYIDAMADCYAAAAETIAIRLGGGLDVALLCEGDPFFYGSSMYLFDRLRGRFPMEIVPGVLGMTGCWAQAQTADDPWRRCTDRGAGDDDGGGVASLAAGGRCARDYEAGAESGQGASRADGARSG